MVQLAPERSNMSGSSKNYQQLTQELDELLVWFESEQVNLDEAIVKYQQALKLLEQMEKYLQTAENKLKKIDIGSAKE